MVIKVISFDVDGTLVDGAFADQFWNDGMPKLLSSLKGISFDEARDYLNKRYDHIGEEDLRWYLPRYWWEDLDLPGTPEDMVAEYAHKVDVFPEVPGVLRELAKSFTIIACSNAAREFLEVSLLDLCGYFNHTFSSTTDFEAVRKNGDFYYHVCEMLGVKAEEVVHVGDHRKFDYEAPLAFGMQAYYLDREGKEEGDHVVSNLKEFKDKIQV